MDSESILILTDNLRKYYTYIIFRMDILRLLLSTLDLCFIMSLILIDCEDSVHSAVRYIFIE